MRIAVIDMGTNTFHLLIVEVDKQDFRIVYREKTAVKIGEKGINQNMITREAIDRALTAVNEFKDVIDREGADHIFATATSAIRNARNGKELVKMIQAQTGIETRIISGLEEAEFIYFGVNKAMEIGEETSLIMDIGGGSIEFIIGTGKEIYWKQSFEIGGLRMVEKFHKHDPIHPDEVTRVQQYLDDHLEELFLMCEKYQPRTLIGSSGTFDTLSDIYSFENGIGRSPSQTELPLTMNAFDSIYQEFLAKTKEERLAMPGMIPLRVDMIVVASVLIDFVLRQTHIRDIRVSAYALKEGVLLSTLEALEKESLL